MVTAVYTSMLTRVSAHVTCRMLPQSKKVSCLFCLPSISGQGHRTRRDADGQGPRPRAPVVGQPQERRQDDLTGIPGAFLKASDLFGLDLDSVGKNRVHFHSIRK